MGYNTAEQLKQASEDWLAANRGFEKIDDTTMRRRIIQSQQMVVNGRPMVHQIELVIDLKYLGEGYSGGDLTIGYTLCAQGKELFDQWIIDPEDLAFIRL